MRTAAAYIRVSTDDQLEYSPDSQLLQIRRYAKDNGFFLPQTNVYCRRPKNLRVTIFFLQKSLQSLCSDSRLMRPGRRLL